MAAADTQRGNYSVAEMDRNAFLHPLTSIRMLEMQGPTLFTRAQGSTVEGPGGRPMLDMGAGLWCVNAGYGREELVEAGARAMRELSYFHTFGGASNEYAARLADEVVSLLREKGGATGLARVFFGTSGSDANDTAYKLVRYYNNLRGLPAKKKVLSRLGAYHGLTHAAAGLTGIPAYHAAFDLPQDGVIHLSCPHAFRFAAEDEDEAAFTARLLAEVEATIEREGAGTIGAMILEPVMGTGGVLLPPAGYLAGLQRILKAHDILLIADEVITGFGRLGAWFGSGHYGLQPDIVTLAKGVTSAYFPLSCTLVSDAIHRVMRDSSAGPMMHGFTYSGHPVGCAIGLAAIGLMKREGLVENAARQGRRLLEGLRARLADHPHVGEVRGEGLMIGVELVADRARRRFFRPGRDPHRLLARACMERDMLLRALPFIEVVSFSPPLSISAEEVDVAIDRFAAALADAGPAIAALAAEG